MGPLIYVVLKTVSNLMTDLNAFSNPGFLFCLIQSFTSFILKIPMNALFFTDFSRPDLKLKHHLMRKLFS